jgi:hypothetical protein
MTMRKTIIYGAIATLLGLAAAEASNNDERAMRNGGRMTYADTDDRGETAEHKMRERAEHGGRHRDDDSREHGKDAREREHRSGASEDRD